MPIKDYLIINRNTLPIKAPEEKGSRKGIEAFTGESCI